MTTQRQGSWTVPLSVVKVCATASSPAKFLVGSFPTRTRPEVPICRSSIQETEPRVSDNIPFLAEEGNVIEGLHFYSYLGWGGQDGNISVLPPPLNRYMNMYI